MTEFQQMIALLKALDARLARIERKVCGEVTAPVYIGTPPVGAPPDTHVIPIRGKIS